MLKSEMLFKRWSQNETIYVDRHSFQAGYNAALDEIAARCEDGIKITPEWAHWMKEEQF